MSNASSKTEDGKPLDIKVNATSDASGEVDIKVKTKDGKAFWEVFYELECELNEALRLLKTPLEISHIYYPLEYASQVHCDYLRRFLDGPKKLLFIGMNPGPDGMTQTGVPFGNISTVRDIMQLEGTVSEPLQLHPKRPIKGLACTRDEPSGKRLWTLLRQNSNDSLDTFFRQCFVANLCPLSFFKIEGQFITPSEIRGVYKKQMQDECLRTMERQLQLLQPEIIVAVGDYVFQALKRSEYCKGKRLLKFPHPSPRNRAHNAKWVEVAPVFLRENCLLKYLRNEVDDTQECKDSKNLGLSSSKQVT